MRVFVTGATGLLGRALIPELLRHDHDVVGLARTDASRAMLRAMHASVYSGQGYNVERLSDALSDMHAIVHLATTIPVTDSAVEDKWPHSSRVVISMLRSLLAASEPHGVRTVVFASFYGVYGHRGDDWVTEETPLSPDPDPTSKAYIDAEDLLLRSTAERKSVGVILRMGQVYGADALHTKGLLYGLERGQAPITSGGQMFWPLVHVRDAAQAIRLAVELAPMGEIFNVCDGKPVRQAKLYTDLAEWVGGPIPPKGGTSELRPYMGQIDPPPMRYSVRVSNRKAREMLGFNPRYPTYWEGYRTVLREVEGGEGNKED
jgi:nucleoside-diphosphate-sugar epimerase